MITNLYLLFQVVKGINRYSLFRNLIEIIIEHVCMIIELKYEIKISEKEIKKEFFEDIEKQNFKEIFSVKVDKR